jgi:hypothetical protein
LSIEEEGGEEEEEEEEEGDELPSVAFGWSAATTALLREDFKSAGVLALPLRTSSRTPSTTRRAARGPKSDAWRLSLRGERSGEKS